MPDHHSAAKTRPARRGEDHQSSLTIQQALYKGPLFTGPTVSIGTCTETDINWPCPQTPADPWPQPGNTSPATLSLTHYLLSSDKESSVLILLYPLGFKDNLPTVIFLSNGNVIHNLLSFDHSVKGTRKFIDTALPDITTKLLYLDNPLVWILRFLV